MSRLVSLVVCLAALGLAVETARGAGDPLDWAYRRHAVAGDTSGGNGHLRTLPGSSMTFTLAQLRDRFSAVDWYPSTHPPMPTIVAHGRPPAVFACGSCHLANGFGGPDNANLAGLPAEYIVQQMAAYRKGGRKSAAQSAPALAMVSIARAVDDGEMRAAADYFSSINPLPWVRVLEVDRLPEERAQSHGSMTPGEPIGVRVVEVPEDPERARLRDTTSGYIAYVPIGSVKRGDALVNTGGNGRTVRCSLCHGSDLRGDGIAPGIAGRSPTYLARQLNDMQHAARFGLRADRMMGTVARLNEADIVAIVAYLASRTP